MQSAVSPIFNRQRPPRIQARPDWLRSAGYKPAIQQTESLRYDAGFGVTQICNLLIGGSVSVKVATEGEAAVLVVADTGQGIGPEDLAHSFERFYRADKARSPAAGRVGLGLAITQAIVQAHGGTIEATSKPGEGSTFTMRLPAASGEPG